MYLELNRFLENRIGQRGRDVFRFAPNAQMPFPMGTAFVVQHEQTLPGWPVLVPGDGFGLGLPVDGRGGVV